MDDDQDKEYRAQTRADCCKGRTATQLPVLMTPPPTHTWTDAGQKRECDMQPRAKRSKDWPTRVDMKTL